MHTYSLTYDGTWCQLHHDRVLSRSYLMTLCIIFPIQVNFPVTSRCVLKATVHRKKQGIVLCYLKKDAFMILYMHVVFD